MKPKVAILTTLVDYSPGYSLTGIILDQARMFQRHGYDYDLLCLKNFNRKDKEALDAEGLSVRYVLAQTTLVDYQANQRVILDSVDEKGNKTEGFETQVRITLDGRDGEEKGYREILEPYDVVIDHDIMFLSWFLPQNAALRQCMDMWPDKNWLHWVHSGPSMPPPDLCYPSDLRYSSALGTYIYLNETQRAEYALMIDAPSKIVRCVYNPKDIRQVFSFASETRELIDTYDLFDHEVLIVYPFSTPRWTAKGVRQLIRLVSNWKVQGVKAKLVLVNAHCSTPSVDKPFLDEMEKYIRACGSTLDEDVIMTSRFADRTKRDSWKYSVPSNVVRDLQFMSNMFVFPSETECCSLIQAEASVMGKFMVLNADFPAMSEFCIPGVLSYDFTRNDPDRDLEYYECVAREIWTEFKSEISIRNRTQAITKTYNEDWIFKHQLEPLLYLNSPAKIASRPKTAPPRKTVTETDPQIVVEEKIVPIRQETFTAMTAQQDFENPTPGLECPIFETCTEELKEECYRQAGHCFVLDELTVSK